MEVNGYKIEPHANLRDVNLINVCLNDADLRNADLRGADLTATDLIGANLSGANLSWACLAGADFRDADLSEADLSNTNLRDANLMNTNLKDAEFTGAKIFECRGIRVFSAGIYNRLNFTYRYDGTQYYQLGCFNGTYEETVKAIRRDYGKDSYYEAIVTAYKDVV